MGLNGSHFLNLQSPTFEIWCQLVIFKNLWGVGKVLDFVSKRMWTLCCCRTLFDWWVIVLQKPFQSTVDDIHSNDIILLCQARLSLWVHWLTLVFCMFLFVFFFSITASLFVSQLFYFNFQSFPILSFGIWCMFFCTFLHVIYLLLTFCFFHNSLNWWSIYTKFLPVVAEEILIQNIATEYGSWLNVLC